MRVKDMAELAGTTPRAVRHYHRLGLLEVPPTVRGARQYGAEQISAFAELPFMPERDAVARAHELAETTCALAMRHKEATLRVLDDLPGGALGRAVWRLTHVLTVTGYPHPAQRAFAARLRELLLADPDLAATIRRSAGEEPVL